MKFFNENRKVFTIGITVLLVIFGLVVLLGAIGTNKLKEMEKEESKSTTVDLSKWEKADDHKESNIGKLFKDLDKDNSYVMYMESSLKDLMSNNSGVASLLDRGTYSVDKDIDTNKFLILDITQPTIETSTATYENYELVEEVFISLMGVNLGAYDAVIDDKKSYYISSTGRKYPILDMGDKEYKTLKQNDVTALNLPIDNKDLKLNRFDDGKLHLEYKINGERYSTDLKGYQVITKEGDE